MNRRTFLAKCAVVAAALPVIGPILRERERRKMASAKLFDYFYQMTLSGSEAPPDCLIVHESWRRSGEGWEPMNTGQGPFRDMRWDDTE